MRDPAVTQDAPTVDRAERHRAPNSERTGSRVLAPQVGCLPTGTSSEEAAMKDAPAEPTGTTTGPAELPTNPPNGRTAGVDWAKDDHIVAVVDSTGTAIDRFTVPHTGTGLAELTRHPAQARLRRGGDRTTGRTGRRRTARGRADRRSHQPEPAEEPALPVRVGQHVGVEPVVLVPGRPVPGAQVLQLVRADDYDGQPGLEQFGDDRSVRSFDRHLGAAGPGRGGESAQPTRCRYAAP